VKFIEEHSLKKDKKLEMNVKTSRDGIAHVPNAPMGEFWFKSSPKVGRPMDAGSISLTEADDQGASREAAEVVLNENL